MISVEIKGDLTILRLDELYCIFRTNEEDDLSIGKLGLLRGQKQIKEQHG